MSQSTRRIDRAPMAMLAICSLLPAAVWADVTNFDLFCNNYFQQTSAAPPSLPSFFAFSARVDLNSLGNFDDFVVTQAGPVSPIYLNNFGYQFVYFSPFYATAASRDADFPVGTFTFSGTGGFQGPQTASRLYTSTHEFTTTPPAFLNYSELQAANSAADIVINPNFFLVPPTADDAHTFLAVYDSTGAIAGVADSAPNAGSFIIPAHMLSPNADYTITLFFSSRVTTNAAGFNGAFSQVGWDAITNTTLHTIPACGSADFNCDGDVGTDADIESFFACLGGSCPPPPCTSSADFNADGDVGTDADIEAFFRVLGGGSC